MQAYGANLRDMLTSIPDVIAAETGVKQMINKIFYGLAALSMIVAIAYGGSWLYKFLLEQLSKMM